MDKKQAKIHFNCINNKPVLAILGGSQGSVPLNHHFQESYNKYTESGIQLLWQCGQNQYEILKNNINNDQVKLIPFSNNMGALYSASDLIISRAGALALSEMAFMGKAMVLVPFPYSSGDHQLKNARSFSNSGAAISLPQSRLKTGELENIVFKLFQNPKIIHKMEKQSSQIATPNATIDIINTILEIAKI
jgi:UDP-N-acetylglucosamine--N-acetylmuramyl-(pentapeptide) pyrophosphoryl-undecaprenol N-acetylglucosamine transferase